MKISGDLSERAKEEGETEWGGCTIKENDELGGWGWMFKERQCVVIPSGPKLKVMEM